MNPSERLTAARARLVVGVLSGHLTVDEVNEFEAAARADERASILGDDLNPSSLVLDAGGYRWLSKQILATMDDPDRWDRDGAQESILADYVRYLADRQVGWAQRPMFRLALELAQERVSDRPDEFTDWDQAALDSMKRLTEEEEG